MTDVELRFWAKVRVGDGCWEWTAAFRSSGYGAFGFRGRTQVASRVAWMLTESAIPEGLDVLHTCDNPKCVRPSHLFLGTPVDNAEDSRAKGRMALGQKSGRAKLNEQQALAIRELVASGERQSVLARRYGVGQDQISRIASGKRWAHLNKETDNATR